MIADVLVTGSNGHLGCALVRALIDSGQSVRAMVRPTSDLSGLSQVDVEYFRADMRDQAAIIKAAEGCRTIYNLAAVYQSWAKDVQQQIIDPAMAGARNVVIAAQRAGVDRLVHVSSVAALGTAGSPDEILDETNWCKTDQDPYITAKTESEKLVISLSDELGVDAVIAIPGLIVGPLFWKLTISTHLVTGSVGYDWPIWWHGGFAFGDVRDIALGLIAASEHGKNGERYILSGENLSIRDFFGRVRAIVGRRGPIARMRRPVAMAGAALMEAGAWITGKPPQMTRTQIASLLGRYMFVTTNKAQRDLGFSHRPIEESLYDTVEWGMNYGFVSPQKRLVRPG